MIYLIDRKGVPEIAFGCKHVKQEPSQPGYPFRGSPKSVDICLTWKEPSFVPLSNDSVYATVLQSGYPFSIAERIHCNDL